MKRHSKSEDLPFVQFGKTTFHVIQLGTFFGPVPVSGEMILDSLFLSLTTENDQAFVCFLFVHHIEKLMKLCTSPIYVLYLLSMDRFIATMGVE